MDVTPQQAKALLDGESSYQYLDVRTPAEFAAGHPPGAWNVPVAMANPGTGRMELNPEFLPVVRACFTRDSKLVVGCKSGGRSATAVQLLTEAGYACAVNMVGGFGGACNVNGEILEEGWSTLGLPVARGPCRDRGYETMRRSAFPA